MNQFMKEDSVKSELKWHELFLGIWPFARRAPLLLGGSLFFLILHVISARLLPQTIGRAIDLGVLPKNTSALANAAWTYLVLEVIHAVSQFCYQYLFQRFGNRILTEIRAALVARVQALPLDYFHKNPVGRIVTRLTNDPANLNDLFSESLVSIGTNFLVIVSIVISMLVISWKLTLLCLGLVPLFLWAAYQISEKMREILRESKKQLSTMNSFGAESLQGMKVLQILDATIVTTEKFRTHSERYKDLVISSIKASALLQPIMNLLTAVIVAVALGGGSFLSLNDGLALGSLVAFLLHAQDFIHPIRDILERYQQFQNSLTSAERVLQVFDEPPEETSPEYKSETTLHAGALEIKDLWFRYQDQNPWVLQGLNISVPAGKRAALMGRTGAGKSTLIALLQRFYEAPQNSIFLDGQSLHSLPRSEVRQFLGVVQQDPVLFRGTIAENLSLSDPNISRQQMTQALQELDIQDYLQRHGQDLDSWVDERGANLSLGERQLLCFARILVFNPPFLILDEATANIDSETEALIQRAVEKITLGRTSLVIAHRLSTLKHCDLFYQIENGRATQVPSAGVNETSITS